MSYADLFERYCKDCGRNITFMHHNRVRCPECQKMHRRKSRRKASQQRKKTQDLQYKIRNNINTRIYLAIKNNFGKKSTDTTKLLGCDIKFFMKYIESQFIDGMTWENYGKWKLDYIMPCSRFDLTDEKQQKECFHYTNYQPLWKSDNIKKSNKLPDKENK